MPYTGRLESRPLLDVIQIVAYSQQSGLLTVKGTRSKGLLIFDRGNLVCAYSPSALPLLVKAAKERDERHRLAFRRIQALTALRELFDLTEGDYRFVRRNEPVIELEGLDIRPFYAAGALDTGDLLLALEKAMDESLDHVRVEAAPAEAAAAKEHASERRFNRYGPIVIRADILGPDGPHSGYLTNLSLGGSFFHADTLPPADSIGALSFELPSEGGRCRISARVVWRRADGDDPRRGCGLSFVEFEGDSKARLSGYLERFEKLAADVDFEA
jgi:hypothetical protein